MPPKRKAPGNTTPKRATRNRPLPIANDEPDELNLSSAKPPSTPGPRPGQRVVMDCIEIVTPRFVTGSCASPIARRLLDAPSTPSRQLPPSPLKSVQFPSLRPPLTPRVSPSKQPIDVPVTPTKRASRPSSPRKGGDLAKIPSLVKLPTVLPAHLVPCLRLQKRAILGALQSSEDIDDHHLLSTNSTAYTQLHNLLHGTSTRGEGNSCLLLGPRGSGKTSVRLLITDEYYPNNCQIAC